METSMLTNYFPFTFALQDSTTRQTYSKASCTYLQDRAVPLLKYRVFLCTCTATGPVSRRRQLATSWCFVQICIGWPQSE